MPFKLVPPTAGRSPFWKVRGTELGIAINRSTKTGDRRLATKLLAQWRAEAQRDAVSEKPKAVETFASAALSYMRANRSPRFLAPLLRHFGETPLREIGQAEIDAAAVALYPRGTPATRNRQVYSPVSAILRHAGVAAPLRRPKGAHDGRRADWLRPEEAFRLLDAAHAIDERLGALLTFLLYCGPRLSEALRLTWTDVDLARSLATLRETKNGTSMTVHLPAHAVAAIGNCRFPAGTEGGRVFRLTKSGRLYQLFGQALRNADCSLPPRSAFHILRHTHATWRRLYTGADTSALVETGLWRSRTAAARYEHIDVSEEARKSDQLPTPGRAIGVRK
jgi:integrase